MPDMVFKSTTVVKNVNKEKRQLTLMASTKDMDRDNEIILPAAYRNTIGNYLKNNPIILPSHNYRADSIGKAVSAKITDDGLEMTIEFAPTPEGQRYWQLYEGGYQRSFSVGFRPKSYKDVTEDSIKDGMVEYEIDEKKNTLPYINGLRRIFTDVELLEVSTCAIPCNPNAVSQLELDAAKMEFLALKAFIEKEEKPPEENKDGEDEEANLEKVKVICKKCGASVNVPKGKTAKCPKCGVTVNDTGAVVGDSDSDEDKGAEGKAPPENKEEQPPAGEGVSYIMIDEKMLKTITTLATEAFDKICSIVENQTVLGKTVEHINECVISIGNIVSEMSPEKNAAPKGDDKIKEEVTALRTMVEKMSQLTGKI
jgi:HK97 family phage prohead protease